MLTGLQNCNVRTRARATVRLNKITIVVGDAITAGGIEVVTKRRRSKGTGSVTRLPDGRYLARFRGKSAVARTEREAERYAAQLAAGTYQPQRTRRAAAPEAPAPITTLADFIPRWLDYCRSRDVSPETITGSYGPALERIARWIGHIDLRQLSPELVALALADMPNYPYSPATVRMSRAVLRRCLATAVTWGYLDANPVQERPPRERPKAPKRISFERAIAIRDAVAGTRAHGPVVCGLYYGMRIGEVLGLRWVDVEMPAERGESHQTGGHLTRQGPGKAAGSSSIAHGGVVLVRGQTLATQEYKGRTKGGREREIPLIPAIETALRAQRVQQAADELASRRYERTGFVWTGPSGRPLSRAYIRLMLNERLPAAGLERATFHSLRHMTATLLRRCGVDEDVRRAILGHESAEVHRGYVEIGRDDLRAALDKLGAALG